jgi:hypothetical protein
MTMHVKGQLRAATLARLDGTVAYDDDPVLVQWRTSS